MHYRFRPLDMFHSRYVSTDNYAAKAADEIIDTPEVHLLSQQDLFWAQGGPVGLAVQLGCVAGGLFSLFTYKPQYLKYFMNA